MDISTLPYEEQERLLSLLKEEEARLKFNKIEWFSAYEWQKELGDATLECHQVLAMCANQIGKSTAGALITAYHLTGLYPEGWEGHKFKDPIYSWASGVSNDTTRDILQTELLGLAESEEDLGTGMIPKHCILKLTRRRGTTGNTYDSVLVQHHDPETGEPNGVSRIGFKSYEMGEEKFYGRPVDWIWLDEQPPSNIYTQCITRTVATNGFVMMTFTPEAGVTPVVHQFMHDRKPGQFLLTATWDDAPHLNEDTKEQLLAQYPPHERLLRSQGIPVFGSGLVFPISEDKIICDPFEIPDHWSRIAAIDFGGNDHPTAVVWVAYDEESDTVYIYDTYAKSEANPALHASAIRQRDQFIPLAWPKDGLQHDKGSGIPLADWYRNEGLNMLPDFFTNPPDAKGKGSQSIERGLLELYHRMDTGRFKVFSFLAGWFDEFRQYHRKEGKVVPIRDDLMSATRYATMSLRFAVAGVGSSSGYSMKGSLPVQDYTYF
jgi:phage terminase large subunit-like protein